MTSTPSPASARPSSGQRAWPSTAGAALAAAAVAALGVLAEQRRPAASAGAVDPLASAAAQHAGGPVSWRPGRSDEVEPRPKRLDPVVAAALVEVHALRAESGARRARERVAVVARLGGYPGDEARSVLRALAVEAYDRLECGAAMAALWERGDREFVEGLRATSADPEFVSAKILALRERASQ